MIIRPHAFQCVRVVVFSNNASHDYYLPRYIAEGLYNRGEISMTQVIGTRWDYFDPTQTWRRWRVS